MDLSEAIFGRLAYRYRRRPVMMASVLCCSVLEFASGFSPTLTAFLVLRALYGGEKAVDRIARAPTGSSCIGASVFGGVCNNSGGVLIHRGPASTQLALLARLDEAGALHLVNPLGIALRNDPQTILRRIDSGGFTPADMVNDPSRFNADLPRLFEASGSAGKVMLTAVRLDTFPKEKEQVVFYIGSNHTGDLEVIRRHILGSFKDLPIEGEYMDRDSFNCAEVYGKDAFLVIHYLGTDMIPWLFALQAAFDNFLPADRVPAEESQHQDAGAEPPLPKASAHAHDRLSRPVRATKGSNCAEIEHAIHVGAPQRTRRGISRRAQCGAPFANPAIVNHFTALDPGNAFNPGIGRTIQCSHWMVRGQNVALSRIRCDG